MNRAHSVVDQVYGAGARVHEASIKRWPLSHRLMAQILFG
jgi:hypothetical protein